MTNQEHIVAVVEPTPNGEAPLEMAENTIRRGGQATVVVVLTRPTLDDIRAFAAAEDLTVPDAKEIFVDRLVDQYSARLGVAESRIVAIGDYSARSVMQGAEDLNATTIAMPQMMARRHGWRGSIVRSRLPVVITPPKAA